MSVFTDDIIKKLRSGGIGVIPTDTLYGLVASALDPAALARIYRVKGRAETKPCIVLIGDMSDVRQFGIQIAPELQAILEKYWPGPVSILLPVSDTKWRYLDRGTGEIAFRLPRDAKLCTFLRKTGPLVAPSANPEGKKPAGTIEDARAYFGDSVDFYVDGGARVGEPSTLLSIEDGGAKIIRRGKSDIVL